MIDIKLFLFGLGSKNLEAGSFAWALSIFRIYRNRRIFRDYFSQCSHFTKKKKKKGMKELSISEPGQKAGSSVLWFFFPPPWLVHDIEQEPPKHGISEKGQMPLSTMVLSFAGSFDSIISCVQVGTSFFCAVDFPRQSSGPTRARLNKMKSREAVTNPSLCQLCEAILHFEKTMGGAKQSITLIYNRKREI